MLHGIRSRMQTQTFGNLDCSLQEILWECLQFTSQQSRKAKKCRCTYINHIKGKGANSIFLIWCCFHVFPLIWCCFHVFPLIWCCFHVFPLDPKLQHLIFSYWIPRLHRAIAWCVYIIPTADLANVFTSSGFSDLPYLSIFYVKLKLRKPKMLPRSASESHVLLQGLKSPQAVLAKATREVWMKMGRSWSW